MNTNWLKARQTKYTAYATVYIAVIVAVLAAANWLANRHDKSYDSTANRRYSLSDQTDKVVKNLKQDVTISYYDKTSAFGPAKDLLERYDTLSPKLKVAYIDPDKKPQLAKVNNVRTYGTIIVQTGQKKEEAKSLSEEEITGALIRALKTGERSVCFVTGSGEHGLDDTGRTGYSSLKELLEKNNYKTRIISLLQKAEVPSDCTILLVGGPKFDYAEPAVNAIKTYVDNGGRAAIFIDPPVKLGREEISDNPALVKTLESWGVTASKDLVLDTSGVGQLFGLSEVVPLVANYDSHVITNPLKDVATAFPMSRSLETKSPAEKLFSSSDNSYATANLSSSEIRINPAKDKKGPLNLGAAGTEKKGRFVVVGSSGWVANNIIRFNGNRDLFLNMMNWLSSDEDLISIRPKESEDRRLSLNKAQMTRIFYSSVIMLPLMVIAAGFSVWWRRR